MSIVEHLFAQHGQLLNEAQHEAISDLVASSRACQLFVTQNGADPILAQSAFIEFERHFGTSPVALFGQDAPSLAHTVIRIYLAEETLPGEFIPGQEIISALISEKALTECMLSSGRGDAGSPITFTHLDGQELPAWSNDTPAAQRAMHTARDLEAERIAERILAFEQALARKPARSNSDLRDAASSLHLAARDSMSASFYAARHHENMAELRNQIITEAAHASLHADKLSRVEIQPLLENHEASSGSFNASNPLARFILDPVPSELKDALRILITAELKVFATRHPKLENWLSEHETIPDGNFLSGREVSSLLSYQSDTADDRKALEKIGHHWNHFSNPHIAKNREKFDVAQGTIALSSRSGSSSHLHATVTSGNDTYFSLKISPAFVDDEFGNPQIRSQHSPLVELEITSGDLMTALRGHPEGRPIPCTFRSICGTYLEPAERPLHQVSQLIKNLDETISTTAKGQRVIAALRNIDELVKGKRSGKAWLDELQDAFAEFQAALGDVHDLRMEKLEEACHKVTLHEGENARAMIQDIAKSLPNHLVGLLGLPKK